MLSRLKKIALKNRDDLAGVLVNWVEGDGKRSGLYDNNCHVDDLVDQNRDCQYSGWGWRILNITDGWNKMLTYFQASDNEDELRNINVDSKQIVEFGKSLITVDDRYYSWSKVRKAAEQVATDFGYKQNEVILISGEVDGADVNPLIDKFKPELEQDDYFEWMCRFKDQYEVISKMSPNFEVVNLFGVEIASLPSESTLFDLKQIMS